MAQEKNNKLGVHAADKPEPSLSLPLAEPTTEDAGADGHGANGTLQPPRLPATLNGEIEDPTTGARRRTARRRPAGPSRNRVAANDDGPSIGGLIFALQQK